MEKRLALVIGNSDYHSQPLKNPRNDANDISDSLRQFGFEVTTLLDCKLEELEDALDIFEAKLDDYDVGMFFFAGHGIQIDNTNQLIMVDTDASSKRKAVRSSVKLDDVLAAMHNSSASTKIVILDACRSNPWKRGWSRNIAENGLASVFAPKGTIIGYATSPGEYADDGIGKNGLYTSALLNQIGAIDRPIEAVFKRVRGEVAAASNGEQTTWEHTSLSGDFFFNTSSSQAVGGYSKEVYADEGFRAEPGSFAYQTIRELKSYNWYKQNPAINSLNLGTINQLNPNEMFVIGRNILQAAEGSSGSAHAFVSNLHEQINPWPEAKARAVLDGILFEIFFDRTGAPRDFMKGYYLDDLVEYRNVPIFRESLEFISTRLHEANVKLVVYPNQEPPVSVTVKIDPTNLRAKVTGVWVGNKDIMTVTEEDSIFGDKDIRYIAAGKDSFESILSERLKAASSQLEISYQPDLGEKEIVYPKTMNFIQ